MKKNCRNVPGVSGNKGYVAVSFFVLNGCIDAVIKLVQLFGPPETVWRTGKANIHWAHSYM